jgi:hypothetical protein
MTSIYKKSIATTLAMTMAVSTAFFAPKRSEAIIGLATGIAPLAIAGVVVAVVGVPLGIGFGVGRHVGGPRRGPGRYPHPGRGHGRVLHGVFTGIALTAIGIVLLEDGSESIQFQPLNLQQSDEFGLTPAERAAFNSSTEELNAMAEDAGLTVQKNISSGEEEAIKASAELWKANLEREAPELRSALAKIMKAKIGYDDLE